MNLGLQNGEPLPQSPADLAPQVLPTGSMMFALTSLALLYVAGVCVTIVGFRKAPFGRQDESGFHEIR